MKLTQLTENFVISNDEFEDYLNRSTEQLKTELETGKNARDAIHDLALTFSAQHNKSYEAYERMSDSLAARMHTLELGQPAMEPAMDVPAEVPAMDNPDMDAEAPSDMDMAPEEPGMDMETPDAEEMPDEQEMADYDAVMNNKEDESVKETKSTSLKDKEDYNAKRKELHRIQMDPNTAQDEDLKKELMRRKAELEDQAKEMGLKEEPETTMSIPSREVQLAGDSIWDKEGKNPKSVRVNKIEVENPFEPGGFLDGDEDDGYRKVDVHHDGPWTIYTDSGFAKEISKIVKMNVDFTEQGMQNDGIASMETTNEVREIEEGEEHEYTVVHAKHGKKEIKAKSSYEAAKKYAEMKKLKGTSGVDAHLHTKESVMIEEGAMDTIKKIVADKQNMPVKFDDGQMKVDLFTASAVSQVYDKVNDANKQKIDNMLKTKAGMLKIADFAMGAMKEGKIAMYNPVTETYSYAKQPNAFSQAKDVVGGAMKQAKAGIGKGIEKGKEVKDKVKNSKAVDIAMKSTGKRKATTMKGKVAQKAAGILGKGAKELGKMAVNFTKDQTNKATGGALGKKPVFNTDDYADELVRRSARITMSEYNEFYKELDKAAKSGKKAGDSITVAGKNIKLKSDPKKMSDLKDSDMDKIDALAQRIYELNQK